MAQFPSGDMIVVTGGLDSRSLSACGQPDMQVKSIAEH
jgi:hypothetical protein